MDLVIVCLVYLDALCKLYETEYYLLKLNLMLRFVPTKQISILGTVTPVVRSAQWGKCVPTTRESFSKLFLAICWSLKFYLVFLVCIHILNKDFFIFGLNMMSSEEDSDTESVYITEDYLELLRNKTKVIS